MNIFDEVDENLFRPLTGTNKRKYVDILALIWEKCKRMPMYAIEKSTIFDMAEEYLLGLDEKVEPDMEEQEYTSGNIADMRTISGSFLKYIPCLNIYRNKAALMRESEKKLVKSGNRNAMQIDIKKNYPAYVDRYDHNAYKDMIEKNRENLKEYSEVLDFMLLNNCKVEQESLRAVRLLENS